MYDMQVTTLTYEQRVRADGPLKRPSAVAGSSIRTPSRERALQHSAVQFDSDLTTFSFLSRPGSGAPTVPAEFGPSGDARSDEVSATSCANAQASDTILPSVHAAARWADLPSCSDSEAASEVEGRSMHSSVLEAPSPSRPARSPLSQAFSVCADSTPMLREDACSSAGVSTDADRSRAYQPQQRCTVGFELPRVEEGGRAASVGAFKDDLECSLSANAANLRVSVPVEREYDSDTEQPSSANGTGYRGVLGMLHGLRQASVEPRDPKVEAVLNVEPDTKVKAMMRRCARGTRARQDPVATNDGMGGTYIMKDENCANCAIFKPCDEEPMAPNNPKGWEGRAMGAPGMKPCVRVGEAALREVAAYVLDHDGFAGVPAACLVHAYHPVLNYKVRMPRIESLRDIASAGCPVRPSCGSALDAVKAPASSPGAMAPPATAPAGGPAGGLSRALSRHSCAQALDGIASSPQQGSLLADHSAGSAASAGHAGAYAPQASHPGELKLGSLQEYVQHMCDANDMSPSCFSADNIHRIGILDIRLLNCDRHLGNILVSERPRVEGGPPGPAYTLIPIDHGYALPEAMDDPYFEWLFWPQASVPFSQEAREYIRTLDAKADIAKLRRLVPGLREECLRCLEVTTTLLQMCADAGLTLYEIGNVLSRSGDEGLPSDLEVMCIDARENALALAAAPPHSPRSSADCHSLTSPRLAAHHAAASALPCGSPVDSSLVSPACDVSTPSVQQFDMDRDDVFTNLFDPEAVTISPAHSSSGASKLQAAAHRKAPALMPPSHAVPLNLTSVASLPSAASLSDEVPTLAATAESAAHTYGPLSSPTLMPAAHADEEDVWSIVARGAGRRSAWRMKQTYCRQKSAEQNAIPFLRRADQANYVFTGLSDRQWRVFMDRLVTYISQELRAGTWRISRNPRSTVAASCPLTFAR